MRRPSKDDSPNYVFLQCLKIFALSAVVTTALQVILADEAQAQTAGVRNAQGTKKAPPAAPPLPAAGPEQMEAFGRAHVGDYACELGQSLTVAAHTTPGYLEVRFLKHRLTMKPVVSSTGAVRLEDVTGRTLMVQIANKSMLLDNKVGQRMVDECVHPSQRSAADAAKPAAS
jgi:hypothetical protein